MSQKRNKSKNAKRGILDKPLNDDAPAKRKVQMIKYDSDGNRLGDDGYPMTSAPSSPAPGARPSAPAPDNKRPPSPPGTQQLPTSNEPARHSARRVRILL
jgi:hypothetical protein